MTRNNKLYAVVRPDGTEVWNSVCGSLVDSVLNAAKADTNLGLLLSDESQTESILARMRRAGYTVLGPDGPLWASKHTKFRVN